MAIEESYLEKIKEIRDTEDALTKWEHDYVFGNPDSDDGPIWERPGLSIKQKSLIERIHKERVLKMDRDEASIVCYGNENIVALPMENKKQYRVSIDRVQVGPIINYSEAVSVVSWLTATVGEGHIKAEPIVAAPPADGTPGGADVDVTFPGEKSE